MSAVAVVGIGADGWDGLGAAARTAIADARVLLGAARQLALVPPDATAAERRAWPTPMAPALRRLPALADEGGLCVLASGDPMLHGIGASLSDRLHPRRLRVHPHPSAFALACARLGWPAHTTELVSAVARPVDVVGARLQPGRRLVVYVTGTDGATLVAAALCERGFGASRMHVAERLGAPEERLTSSAAHDLPAGPRDPLHLVAIEVAADAGTPLLPHTPGLPDDAYVGDGQLTKRDVRALTVCALAPRPRALLWDVGAGSGTIGIEWLRAEPSARAVAVEPRADRRATIAENARRLGVPRLEVADGSAPAALEALEAPDVVFVGGGASAPGVLETCWRRLRPGGRIVANVVTLEGEQALTAAHARHGGRLVRIALAQAAPVGGFTGWRAQMPVTQWVADKEDPA